MCSGNYSASCKLLKIHAFDREIVTDFREITTFRTDAFASSLRKTY
jgi:hypothetical protein